MADDLLSKGQIRPPTRKPPEMLGLLPMTQEEIFKHRLMKVQEREDNIKPLTGFLRGKFNALQDSVPGEVRSLLMHQLLESWPSPSDPPEQKDFSEENDEVLQRILADRELKI